MNDHQHNQRPNEAVRRSRRAGFTIIELLTVVGIIIILLSIIIVAVNAAVRTAQATNTRGLMNSINQGLVQFRSDIGYLPPVLASWQESPPAGTPKYRASRNYGRPPIVPIPGAADSVVQDYIQDIQTWFSITSIPEYLLGSGHALEVGYGRVPAGMGTFPEHDNDGPLGIRHPGSDGYWSVAMHPASGNPGELTHRHTFLPTPAGASFRRGRVYGPYFELRDDRLIGAVSPNAIPNAQGQYEVYFPGDALPPGLVWDELPKVIVDYWGQPIRYYRKPYVPGQPGQDLRGVNERLPTLSDVFALRPYRLRSGEVIDVPTAPDEAGDTTTTQMLHSASSALLSAGPDRRIDPRYRADPEELNRDNIVELGR